VFDDADVVCHPAIIPARAIVITAFLYRYKSFFMLGGIIAARWIGFAWLCRRHPIAAIMLVGFLKGLLGRR
jgi:hypothetical protein